MYQWKIEDQQNLGEKNLPFARDPDPSQVFSKMSSKLETKALSGWATIEKFVNTSKPSHRS